MLELLGHFVLIEVYEMEPGDSLVIIQDLSVVDQTIPYHCEKPWHQL